MAADTAGRYAALVEGFLATTEASVDGKGFGAGALKVRGKIFAMLSSRGEFVVKLPRQRVAELVAAGAGQPFDPGHGRLMREWLALEPGASDETWGALAHEALAFVGKA